MRESSEKKYRFGDFELDSHERALKKAGAPVALTPKVFDLLEVLVENHGHLMTKDELIRHLWQDSFVEEANLNVNISALRRALGETPTEHKFIETVPRRGYRFIAEVTDVSNVNELSELSGPADARRTAPARILRLAAPIAIVLALTAVVIVWKVYFATNDAEVSNLRTIAVLPFRPLAGGQSDPALQLGMADALITKLSALERLTVRPTSAIERYIHANDPIAVGRELQVEAVLDGKIQRSENRIRVTVQLLRVSDSATLWTGTFDDFFTNIFAVQDSISERMLDSLSFKLSSKEEIALAKRHTENTEAYQLFLQGQFHHEQISRAGTENALKYYRAAADKDPDYALAYASMAPAFIHLANLNIDRDVNMRSAREAAERSVTLDADLADAHEALAAVYDVLDWNWSAAEAEYKKAIELNPKREGPHFNYSSHLSRLKRHDEAVREIETARRINPVGLYIQNQLVHTLIRARRFTEAEAEIQKSLEMSPENSNALNYLVRVSMYQAKFREAKTALESYKAINGLRSDGFQAWYEIRAGDRELGEKMLRSINAKYISEGGNYGWIALNFVRLGEHDKAFEALEKAYERREFHLLTLNIDPDWDPLRSDPRLAALISKIGLPN